MKNLELTKNEIATCQKLVEQFFGQPDLMTEKLKALGKDPTETRQQIEDGVSDFYEFYKGEVNKETIQAKIQDAQKDMTPLQKYTYLANLMTAIAHIGGKVFDDTVWNKCLEDHQNILTAIQMGLIKEDGLHVEEAVEEMQSIVSENIEAFAVLFVDNPDLAELQEACLTEETDRVKAIAYNTREMAINTAAALYILQESGKLTTLGDTRYPPSAMGVLSASMLEIDAAQKTGSMDTFKKVFQKASRTAVTLLAATPGLLVGLTLFGLIGLFSHFAAVWMIIGGLAIGMNLKVHYDTLKEKLEPVFAFGGRVLDVTLNKVKPLYAQLSGWVQNTVIPNAIPVWNKCRIFIRNCIMIPAVRLILKAKDIIVKTAQNLKMSAEQLIHSAKNIAVEGNVMDADETDEVSSGSTEVNETETEEDSDLEEEESVEE